MQPHDVLGVAADADLETVRRAYFERAKTMHPDVGGSEKDFVRLHAAFESMVTGFSRRTAPRDHEADSDRRRRQSKHTEWAGRERRRQEDRRREAAEDEQRERERQQHAFDEIMREARERLDQETAEVLARGPCRQRASMAGFWFSVILTPLLAAAMATCFCYNGKPLERPLWSFSFAIAMAILVYTGGMAAALGASLGTSGTTVYRRIVILLSIAGLLIAFPWSLLRNPDAEPDPLIVRHHVPDWWPSQ